MGIDCGQCWQVLFASFNYSIMQLKYPIANIYIFLWVAAISAVSNRCTQKDNNMSPPNNLCISTFEGNAWNNVIENIRPVHIAVRLCAVLQLMHECWVNNPPLHTGRSTGGGFTTWNIDPVFPYWMCLWNTLESAGVVECTSQYLLTRSWATLWAAAASVGTHSISWTLPHVSVPQTWLCDTW